jgi:DNA-binding LacI/PurR family transcriptional regulator
MSDIAHAEGVSITAVSYVLNGRGDAMRIPPATQKRILARCKKMNYSRDYLASALASRRTQTIGVVFTNALGDFMNEILWGIHEALREKDQEVMLCFSEDQLEIEADDIRMLEHRHVDGIIAFPVVATVPSHNWENILSAGCPPVVFVDNIPPGVTGSCVRIDDFSAGRAAAQKAFEEGVREVVIVLPQRDALTLQERLAGFQTGAMHLGLKLIASFSAGEIDGLSGLLAEKNRRIGFFAPRSGTLLRPLRMAFEQGKLAAEHVFFTIGEVAEAAFLPNQWWMLRQPGREMGRMAARILLERIAGTACAQSSTTLPTSWTCNKVHKELKTREIF